MSLVMGAYQMRWFDAWRGTLSSSKWWLRVE
jgi:hypothetical protein